MSEDKNGPMEPLKVAIGIIISVATVYISYNSYVLNEATAVANQELAEIKQQLEKDRFGFDRLKDIYDRTQTFLAQEQQNERWGRALVVLIGSLPDDRYRQDLAEIVRTQSTSASVSSDAANVILAGSEPIVPRSFDDYRDSFLFAKGDKNKTDVTVYVCERPAVVDRTLKAASAAGDALASSGHFGLVKGGLWRGFDGYIPNPGTFTIVIDEDHPERAEYEAILSALGDATAGLDIRKLPNPGKDSPWLISLIACA